MNQTKPMFCALAVAAMLWTSASVRGVDDIAAAPNMPGMNKGDDGEEKKKDFPDYDTVVTKEHKEIPVPTYASSAFYKMFHDEKKDELLAVVPSKHLGQNVMISNSIVAAPGVAGWMWGDRVVRWERRDKKLLLIEPDTRNSGKDKGPLSDAVRRTYTDRVVKTVNIKALSGADPVIDLGELFKQDFGGIGRAFGGKLDGSLAKYIKVKCFENNIVVTVESPFGGGQGGWRASASAGTLISVNYNISSMPDTGYEPRLSDNRIGYFTTVRRDWSKGYKSRTLFDRYVQRWHLEKQDPSLEKSPVKNPIVFYVEKTVPVRYRQAVKEGILEWNKAFEKCGFIDAMQVRQQTETNEFSHIDPEDVNYNFFRWTATGTALAVGPSRANPFTGQIYDADIVFDDAWVRYPIEFHATFSPAGKDTLSEDRRLQAFFKEFPHFAVESRQDRLLPNVDADITATEGLQMDPELLAKRFAQHSCNYGAHVQHELGFAHSVIDALGYEEIPLRFIQQIVKEVAMHEVGHTLGLRHNFKASSWLPLDEVLGCQGGDRPLAASVMDYNAFMVHPDKEKQGDFAMTTLGPYDEWAILYGYAPVADPHKSEEELLKSITDRVAESGLDYATDEDTWLFSPDPLVNRRDMGGDPLEYAKYRVGLVQKLRQNMQDWGVKDGESYSVLRKRFNRLLSEMASASMFAGRYIGGQYMHRDHKGDPNARDPFVIVPAAKQREAMQFLARNIFSAEAFQFDPQLLNKLAPGRWGHWNSDDYDSYLAFDLDDRIDMIMRTAMLPLFNPFTINRLHNMQRLYEADEEPYTLAEHMQSLTNMVWKELNADAAGPYSERKPFIASSRRSLQRAYTENMVYYLTSTPGLMTIADAHSLIRMIAEDLHGKIEKAKKSEALDDTSKAHLLDISRRLQKALEANFVQN